MILRDQWVSAIRIRRQNFVPSRRAVLCSAHFTEEEIDRTSLCTVRLREGAVPKVFENADQSKGYKNKRLKSRAVPKVFKAHPPHKQHHTRGREAAAGLNHLKEEECVPTKMSGDDDIYIPPADCSETETEFELPIEFETPQPVTSAAKRTIVSKGTSNMLEGNNCFGKLTEDKLRHLIELLLKVAWIDVDLLNDCLHGGRQIVDAWKEVDKLCLLIEALRKELKPELDVYHSPPPPSCFVGRPKPQPQQQTQCDDGNDEAEAEAGESEDVASTGHAEVDDETGAVSSGLQIQSDTQKSSPGPKAEAGTIRPQTAKTAAEYPKVRLQKSDKVKKRRRLHTSVIEEKLPIQSQEQEKSTAVSLRIETDQSQKLWACDSCDESFLDKASLDAHYKRHEELNAHQKNICNLCGEKFKLISTLRAHVVEAHNHSCVVCNRTFRYAASLKSHEERYPGGGCKSLKGAADWERNQGPCICDICGKILKNKETFRVHYYHLHKDQNSNKTYICNICGKEFKMFRNYKIHIHAYALKVSCRFCKHTFGNIATFKRHEEKYRKGLCFRQDKVKKEKGQWEKLGHEMPKPSICDRCGVTFDTRGGLRAHIRRHKALDENQTHCCHICGKEFKLMCALKRHLKTHTNTGFKRSLPKRKTCHVCNKIFNSNNLLRHMKVHTGERPWKCTYTNCGKSFSRHDQLKWHMKRHTCQQKNCNFSDVSLECSLCAKVFKTKQKARAHMNIHIGVRFTCHVCNKTFGYLANLKRHKLEVHSKVRRFKCEICGRSFAQKFSLDLHQWTHRTDKRFTCEACGYGTNDKRNFRNHVKKTGHSTPALTVNQGQQSTQTTAYTTSQAPTLCAGDNPSVFRIGHYSYGNGLELEGHQRLRSHQGSTHPQVQLNNSNPPLQTDMLYTVVVSPQQELF